MIPAALCAMALIAAIDLPGVLKAKNRRDIIVCSALLALVTAYVVAFACGLEFTSSFYALQMFMKNTLGLSYT